MCADLAKSAKVIPTQLNLEDATPAPLFVYGLLNGQWVLAYSPTFAFASARAVADASGRRVESREECLAVVEADGELTGQPGDERDEADQEHHAEPDRQRAGERPR